jgi:hypothetical protein
LRLFAAILENLLDFKYTHAMYMYKEKGGKIWRFVEMIKRNILTGLAV